MASPSEDFVRLVSADLLAGRRFTPAIKDQFTQITKRAFQQLIGARINDRLREAMSPEVSAVAQPAAPLDSAPPTQDSDTPGSVIETTLEEIEGFHIVRSILRDIVPSKRIFMRDAQSYCAVLFDDNNRKPICRLRFNNPQRMVIGLMNGKDEEKMPIADLDEIYNFSERLKATVSAYVAE